MTSAPQIMALSVSLLIVTQSLFLLMLNFVSTQEKLRHGGNSVNNLSRSILKEPILPTFVPGASNKYEGYTHGDLYWWPPPSLTERPSTFSPEIPQGPQTKFKAFNPKIHSKTPIIKFEEDSDAFTTKSTETTTDISQISSNLEGDVTSIGLETVSFSVLF